METTDPRVSAATDELTLMFYMTRVLLVLLIRYLMHEVVTVLALMDTARLVQLTTEVLMLKPETVPRKVVTGLPLTLEILCLMGVLILMPMLWLSR